MRRVNIKVKIWFDRDYLKFLVLEQREKSIAGFNKSSLRDLDLQVLGEDLPCRYLSVVSEACPELRIVDNVIRLFLRGVVTRSNGLIGARPVAIEDFNTYRNILLTGLEAWSAIVLNPPNPGSRSHVMDVVYKEFPVSADGIYEL